MRNKARFKFGESAWKRAKEVSKVLPTLSEKLLREDREALEEIAAITPPPLKGQHYIETYYEQRLKSRGKVGVNKNKLNDCQACSHINMVHDWQGIPNCGRKYCQLCDPYAGGQEQ